jgi:hypothetical protein
VRPIALPAVSNSGTGSRSGEILGSKRHCDRRHVSARQQGAFQELSSASQKVAFKFFSELFLTVRFRILHLDSSRWERRPSESPSGNRLTLTSGVLTNSYIDEDVNLTGRMQKQRQTECSENGRMTGKGRTKAAERKNYLWQNVDLMTGLINAAFG